MVLLGGRWVCNEICIPKRYMFGLLAPPPFAFRLFAQHRAEFRGRRRPARSLRVVANVQLLFVLLAHNQFDRPVPHYTFRFGSHMKQIVSRVAK